MLVSLLAPAAYGHHVYEIQCQNSLCDGFLSHFAPELGLKYFEEGLMQEMVMFFVDILKKRWSLGEEIG